MTKRRLPSYNITNVLRLREKIMGDLDIVGYMFTQPDRRDFNDFVKRVHSLMPDGIPIDTIKESADYLFGIELGEQEVDMLAWRLAGNVRRLRSGHPVLPWAGIPDREWMPVQVTQVSFAYTKRGKPAGLFDFVFLAGQAAGLTAERIWPKSYCHVLAPRMGFTKWASSRYPFEDTSEFTNLRMMVAVEPGQQEIAFEDVACPPSMVSWNHRYIRMRARTLEGFKCPRKLPQGKPCFRCYLGQDRCPAAVRPQTLEKMLCAQCDETKFHDPEYREVCLDCHHMNLRKELNQ